MPICVNKLTEQCMVAYAAETQPANPTLPQTAQMLTLVAIVERQC